MKGHFTDYLNRFQETYQRLLESGKDLYFCKGDLSKDVFALPNTEVEYNKDGSVEITPQILEILKRIFPENKDLEKGKIFPYKRGKERIEVTLNSLETIVNGGSACIETPYSG